MGRQPRPPDLRVTSTGLPLQVCELRAGGLRIGLVVCGWWFVEELPRPQPLTANHWPL